MLTILTAMRLHVWGTVNMETSWIEMFLYPSLLTETSSSNACDCMGMHWHKHRAGNVCN